MLHFNNAGAALIPQPVLDIVERHQRLEADQGGYEAAELAEGALEAVYRSVARLLGCGPEEIALVENATRAWDMAFYGVPLAHGDRIITGVAEYASNYIAMLQRARACGARIEVVPNDPAGQLSLQALGEALDRPARLLALTHVPSNSGLVNPAEEAGRLARETGVLYLLDACQSAGQLPLDVGRLGCDMLSLTGRKYLRGPRGTGALYVREAVIETLQPPFLDLHAARWTAANQFEVRGDARRFECWERNVAATLGLGAAIDYALDWGLKPIENRICVLAEALREGLGALPDVTVTDPGARRCGLVSFISDRLTPPEIKRVLRERAINVSVSTAFSTRLDMDARGLPHVVRASVHYYNTLDEVTRFCLALS